MGFPPLEHPNIPEVQEAIKRVLAACKAAGKYAGMFCTAAEQVQARFEQGCTLLPYDPPSVCVRSVLMNFPSSSRFHEPRSRCCGNRCLEWNRVIETQGYSVMIGGFSMWASRIIRIISDVEL